MVSRSISRPDREIGSLENLPDEPLYRICAFLAPRQVAMTDIANFSLASKKCVTAAGRKRLERIIIVISTSSVLRQDVNELIDILSRSARFGCIRQVKIKDSLSPQVVTGSELVWRDRQTLEDEGSDADDDNDEDLCRLPRFRKQETPLHHTIRIDASLGNWLRGEASTGGIADINRRYWCLSVLLGKLRSLNDLVWDCAMHIPLCLLMSLEKQCSDARLHVHQFHLQGGHVNKEGRAEHGANRHEWALVRSPSLHSAVWKRQGGRNHANMNNALWCMLRGAAPKLKHVVMNWCGPRRIHMDA